MDPTRILSALRVVELSAFVAVPFAGMTLSQMGAEVIRIDHLGGGLDFQRWPVTENGDSLYWSGLNQGKKSVTLDLRTEEGQELVRSLVCSPGDGGGIVITNLSPRWLAYEELAELRPDLIMISLEGNPDGTIAVDYTVNAAVGFPFVTGDNSDPVNHVLPAWDLSAGAHIALAVLAALLHRRETGEGQYVELALSDLAFSALGHLGIIGEVVVNDRDRQPYGNYVYGSFGRDFETADGRRVMAVALTPRQWESLLQATATAEAFEALQIELGEDLREEGARFEAREHISAILGPWFRRHSFGEVRAILDAHRVCWGPYQSFRQAVETDPRVVDNPLFQQVDHPKIGPYPTPGSPLRFSAFPRMDPRPAPSLGEDTAYILQKYTDKSDADLENLREQRII